jgi:hypothetical protein
MKQVHTEDQEILGATIHSIVACATGHLGFEHPYTRKKDDSNVNNSGVSGTVVRCHSGMTTQKWLVHVQRDRRYVPLKSDSTLLWWAGHVAWLGEQRGLVEDCLWKQPSWQPVKQQEHSSAWILGKQVVRLGSRCKTAQYCVLNL